MDKGFFASTPFYVALAVAIGLVVAGVGTYALAGSNIGYDRGTHCDAPSIAGPRLEPAVSSEARSHGEERTTSYALDAASLRGGALDMCLSVGDIVVLPSAGDQVEARLIVTADSAEAVDTTSVQVVFARSGEGVAVYAWQDVVGRTGGIFRGSDSANVRLEVMVPDSGAYAVAARTDVGDIDLRELRLATTALVTDVGRITLDAAHMEADLSAETDVGDIVVALASVRSGNVTLLSDVGDVDLRLPLRADVGYHVRAESDVGDVEVDVGPAERNDRTRAAPSDEAEVRSQGYAERPTQVSVEIVTDVGDVTVIAA